MANHTHADARTRIHWGKQTADSDIHLEYYSGLVDGKFQYNALFRMLSGQNSTIPDTNTYRIDRLGVGAVKARKSGETLEPTRIANSKLNITVGVSLYTQNVFDYMDVWTSPDRTAQIARDNGTLFAKLYDQAHIIQLIKARSWKAPAELKGAFHDGITGTVQLKAAPANIAEYEANAYALEAAHKAAVEELIRRDTPMDDLVTIVSPRIYSALTHHPKLIGKDFSEANGDFANRRVLKLNGVTIVESTAFPTEAITNHVLTDTSTGSDFNVDADDIKHEMIVFSRSLSLVTVTAKELHSGATDKFEDQVSYLTTVCMYNVGVRRPDCVAALKVERI